MLTLTDYIMFHQIQTKIIILILMETILTHMHYLITIPSNPLLNQLSFNLANQALNPNTQVQQDQQINKNESNNIMGGIIRNGYEK
jgi:hypothetical protein